MSTTIRTLLTVQFAVVAGIALAQTPVAKAHSVAYRLKDTKTLHFEDAQKAQRHLDTVRRLGCESRMEDHGGHQDVSYRLQTWKALTLDSEATAHQWENWMKESGFETIHAHTEGQDHTGHNHGLSNGHFHGDGHDHDQGPAETLVYSMSQWQTTHTRDRREADELVAILKGLGCEIRSNLHEQHEDIVFRCPQPMHLELSSHRVASNWQGWLTRTGFQTRHVH